MRVAIAGLHTETNTFSDVEPDLSAENSAGVLRGEQILEHFTSSQHMIAGFLRACGEERVEVVPLLYANAMACGMLSAADFKRVSDAIVEGLARQGPFDVVLLAGHGAAVSASHADAEGELAERVRACVGAEVVVANSLDLHGNITERLVGAVDVALGYRENPHTDPVARGAECARLAIRCARGEVRPVQRLVRLPMVVPILGGWTGEGPMAAVMAEAERIAAEYGLLSFTVFHGFGYADVPHMGSSVVAIADGDPALAERAAADLAEVLWSRREQLRGAAAQPGEAVAAADARAGDGGAVVLLDVGDNIGAGSPGDSTVLLDEALRQRVRGFVATLCDAAAVERAVQAGLGAEVELNVGGGSRVSVGPRLQISGRVTRITDGRFEDPKPAHAGFRFYDGGPTVRLSTAAGQELVISSRTVAGLSPEQLRAVGIEPREQRVVVAKGVVAPRAGYGPVASEFIVVDTPGVTAANLEYLSFSHRPRPLWPLEAETSFALTG